MNIFRVPGGIMNVAEIEENISILMSKWSRDTFIYDFLLAYGLPKASITRLKQGTYNLSREDGEILWKKKIFFKEISKDDLHSIIDEIKNNSQVKKQNPRFLIVTDYKTFLAIDTKTMTSLDIEMKNLEKHFDFFLPLGGFEKVELLIENPADVKAAEKMAKLYDQIRQDNLKIKDEELHELNVFLSRLLFCYFAEDTGIFEKGSFTSSIASHTSPDGSDLSDYLDRFFDILNSRERGAIPKYLERFPYVNGGLLSKKIKAPRFTAKSWKILIECGGLDWSAINPDIFGSMIQAVVHPEQRGGMGMHYTSVPNIMKVLRPLFLDNLYFHFEQNYSIPTKLCDLLNRIEKIKFFDPACGSGNFLIIAYKEIRHLEIKILKRLSDLSLAVRKRDKSVVSLPKVQKDFLERNATSSFSRIYLHNFYGIEIDGFASEIALLSLWLAEHQMNLVFKDTFGVVLPTLPLKPGGNISTTNSIEADWNKFCQYKESDEIYIMGNPPYLGSKNHTEENKKDIKIVFRNLKGAGTLDYVSCWIARAASYIRGKNIEFAFVATNSICQGEQVGVLWPYVLKTDLEIGFAHQSFKWSNNAKNKAGVTCVIINVRNVSRRGKILYKDNTFKKVKNINAYLVEGPNTYISKKSKSINGLPKMGIGNKPIDNGNYLFSEEERLFFLKKEPGAKKYFLRWFGSDEFLNGKIRWCLLTQKIPESELKGLPLTRDRIKKVEEFRRKSKSKPTRDIANTPKRFHVECFPKGNFIVIPEVSSEKREYIPVGYLSEDVLASSLLRVIHSSDPFVFGLVSSRMHMCWVKAVAGRLETRFRYSNELCYNTFPIPSFTKKQISNLSVHSLNILQEREKEPETSIGDLYDPEIMPHGLREAHKLLDDAVDRCYRSKPFLTDEERLEHLFSLYQESTK